MSDDADVIIVGAGLAGLVAAAEIVDAGKKIIILDQEPAQSLGGQAFEIALIKEGGDWKLNELVGFTELDTEALAKYAQRAGTERRHERGGVARMAQLAGELGIPFEIEKR